jgi:hypothetical protein
MLASMIWPPRAMYPCFANWRLTASNTLSLAPALINRSLNVQIAGRSEIWLVSAKRVKRKKRIRPSSWDSMCSGNDARNAILDAARRLGRKIWKKWTGYHRRSLVETRMRCFKLLGERVVVRDFDRQVAELRVRTAILNRFTRLGTPRRSPCRNSIRGLGYHVPS